MSSPMMNMMLGFLSCACARAGPTAAVSAASTTAEMMLMVCDANRLFICHSSRFSGDCRLRVSNFLFPVSPFSVVLGSCSRRRRAGRPGRQAIGRHLRPVGDSVLGVAQLPHIDVLGTAAPDA